MQDIVLVKMPHTPQGLVSICNQLSKRAEIISFHALHIKAIQ